MKVVNPDLWSPEEPSLYKLYTVVKDAGRTIVDGYYQYIGIRTFDFRGTKGFFLNGKPYTERLMGANRHQDYALIGNAVPNNLHWQDAELMREAGIMIVRGSHYPQDPAFMEACDRLGIFVIVCTPGWQFWNTDPTFEEYAVSDIRNMVRRDRNRPCVIMWEALLNETHVLGSPVDMKAFTKRAYAAVHEEYPYDDCFAAANVDKELPESEIFDVFYDNPGNIDPRSEKTYYTREWGDNVDEFYSHNSDSRVALSWGETPQLVQAAHYANPDETFGSWEAFHTAPRNLIGGTLWHFSDTERGYHPDPFYGGIVDNFRRKKYSYHMFQSQQDPDSPYLKKSGPASFFLTIANEMTPFSPGDVTVYTNCDSVKLTILGGVSITKAPDPKYKMPHAPIIFEDVYGWSDLKRVSRNASSWEERDKSSLLLAEGYHEGKVVIETRKRPSFRPVRLQLETDYLMAHIYADGSTVVPVVASVVDDHGTVKRLNNTLVKFEVEGDPVRQVSWGSAVALVRTTPVPGEVKVRVTPLYKGTLALLPDVLFFTSSPQVNPVVCDPSERRSTVGRVCRDEDETKMYEERRQLRQELLKVDDQQQFFGEKYESKK